MEKNIDDVSSNSGMIERILRPSAASEMLGLSISSFYELAKEDPFFPKSLTIGKARKGFLLSEIQAYIQQIKARRDELLSSLK